jgi:FMN phosphatase YigB (HAD superfamily)
VAKLALPPAACAFIDDLPENVEGARAAGMHGIRYTGPEALEMELRSLGVVV